MAGATIERETRVEISTRAAKTRIWLDRLLVAIFLLLVLGMTVFISSLKLGELYSWHYTSDLFTYDQIMQEILGGNFGLEYTYGNQFGDHALLILVILAPLRLVLGRYMVDFLVLLGPLTYALSAGAFFFVLRRRAGSFLALLSAVAYLGAFMVVQGLGERIYGCHVDTLSGFVATALAVMLVGREQALDSGTATRRFGLGFWIVLGLFMSLKEEMALLAIAFFAVVCLFRRDRFHFKALGIAAAVFVAEMLLIRLCATPWNRTNEALLSGFVDMLLKKGPADPSAPSISVVAKLLSIYVAVYAVSCLSALKVNPYALGLLAIGIAKLALGFMVKDADLATWHNFPGIVMLTGAVALQLAAAAPTVAGLRRWLAHGIAAGAAVTGVVLVVNLGIPYVTSTRAEQAHVKRDVLSPEAANGRRRALAEAKTLIDPRKITAIYGNTAVDWRDGYRYSFFPRGVFWSPKGIADYVVVDVALPEPNMAGYFSGDGLKEFAPILQTRYIVVLERRAIKKELVAERDKFVQHFGADAIGGATRHPVASVASGPAKANAQ